MLFFFFFFKKKKNLFVRFFFFFFFVFIPRTYLFPSALENCLKRLMPQILRLFLLKSAQQ